MKVLLTNDDGIEGKGLWAMAYALKKIPDIEVAISAPMKQQSGMSHALSVLRRIEYKIIDNPDFDIITIDGTPTDCVKIYLETMNPGATVGAVISGINDGANLATDVLYSGTVGAALEGFLNDFPALAVSLDLNSEIPFESAAEATAQYFCRQIELGGIFFHNINFPKKYRNGKAEFQVARLGKRDYLNGFKKEKDPDGKTYFQVGGKVIDFDTGEGTDIYATEHGFVSVTPLHADTTDYEEIPKLAERLKGGA